ncbi:hypothetical protein M9H77_27243 [Catharanthus roseus]|uniref:Uncharacterized protein n=1 Tax=Catharanthus roseus TaxID=4058 RepID=A0ACC0AC50_CATRO|nr:hypothetical protein M9H77_27243 [Catharanthus roseus]
MEEQLQQTEQFNKSHVPPRNILRFFREQDVGCAVSAQKIYNIVTKIKNNRMQGRNTIEEVLFLTAKWGYMVFYRNREESNVQYATIGRCRDDSDRKELHSGNNFYVQWICYDI